MNTALDILNPEEDATQTSWNMPLLVPLVQKNADLKLTRKTAGASFL
jgi:hypothetical protein